MNPVVTQRNALDMQVCVPSNWSDSDVKIFADSQNKCGTDNGWDIRKEGDKALAGDPERRPCTAPCREGFVHIMLDA